MKLLITFFSLLILLSFRNDIELKNRIINRSQILEDENIILWQANVKLTWDDFQCTPDSTSKYKALTSTEIKTEVMSYTKEELVYDISCRFEKKKSWTKLNKASLLNHEQLHFDIAELATRKMREKFSMHKSLDLNSINSMINKIFGEAVKERRALNKFYDSETNHGIIEDKQKEWEAKIAKELKALEKYANTRVVIKRVKK